MSQRQHDDVRNLLRAHAVAAVRQVGLWLRAHDYRGIDPYQLDERAFGRIAPRAARLARRVLKPLHPLIPSCVFNRLPPVTVPKALALVIGANAHLGQLGIRGLDPEEQRALLERLAGLRSNGFIHMCWGVPFSWGGSPRYPASYPMAIVTAIVGLELLKCRRVGGGGALLDSMCASIRDYFLNEHMRWEDGDNLCFYYSNLDELRVFNASALVLAFLSRLGNLTVPGVSSLLERGVNYLLSAQRDDGSWTYMEGTSRIDGRHSGYVLQALTLIAEACPDNRVQKAVDRGWDYYRDRLLDGPLPKWTPEQTYPIDIHDVAQAVITSCAVGSLAHAEAVLQFALSRMYSGTGEFYYKLFQDGKVNKTVFVRWNQAWMYAALAEYLARSA